MDPSDPAPLVLTTEELLPILDHLSTSRSHTASGSLLAIHSPIPLALLESTLDLLAQVQIEDERMDRVQKVDGEKRGKKRDTWGSLVGMMRMTVSSDCISSCFISWDFATPVVCVSPSSTDYSTYIGIRFPYTLPSI
jgi:hypothetical protein